MRNPSEKNHAENLANFDALIAKLISYGRFYKPSKNSLQLATLTAISQNARVAIENVSSLNEEYVHRVNIREMVFETLKQLNQRIYSVLLKCYELNELEIYMLIGSTQVFYNPFTAQQRYDFLLENFCRIIKLLKTIPSYHPIDSTLQIENLESLYKQLSDKNNEVKRIQALLANAKLIRAEVMYREHNGLVALASKVKVYIKYHYGWNSEQYKQIANLSIKKVSTP